MSAPAFLSVGALTHRYVDEGPRDADALVFIHALGCDLDCWAAVSGAFTATHRCIRYDLRGHGLADNGGCETTLADFYHDLFGLLAQLGITSATLIGISLGGLIAQAVALAGPAALVRRVVLCATLPRIGTAEMWRERISLLRASGLEAAADTIVARWFTPDFAARHPAIHRGWRNRLARSPLHGYLAACAALRDADLRPHSAALRVPALVLAGEHDLATPAPEVRAFAASLPGARFVQIAACSHLPPIEQSAATVAALSDFLLTTP